MAYLGEFCDRNSVSQVLVKQLMVNLTEAGWVGDDTKND